MRLFEIIVVVFQKGNASMVDFSIAFLNDNLCATVLKHLKLHVPLLLCI